MRGSGVSYKKRKLNVTPQSLQRLLVVRPKKSVTKGSTATAKKKKKQKSKTTNFKDIFD